MNGQETEVKFYVRDLGKIETRLIDLDAKLLQPRVHETNLRFDTSKGSLRKEGKVLRLRQDETAKLTFKSDTVAKDGILSRKEIEFEVGDFDMAKEFVESLGYEVFVFYEKYRRTYELNGLHIMLDELPYGDFVEIEGNDIDGIKRTANALQLNLDSAVEKSYHALFEKLAKKKNLKVDSLSFEAIRGWKPSAKELGVSIADVK